MHDVYFFSDKNLSEQGYTIPPCEEGIISVDEWKQWQMINLQSIVHDTHARSFEFEFIGDKHNFVAQTYQGLCKLVTVSFNTATRWSCKVGGNQDIVFLLCIPKQLLR